MARTGIDDEDIQGQANQPDKDRGLVCRKCGCRHFFVVWTMPARDGSIRRCKACRNCGLRIRTREKTVE